MNALLFVAAKLFSGLTLLFNLDPVIIKTDDPSAYIEAPESCASKIGTGGNFIAEQFELLGKCEGNGNPPRMQNGKKLPEIVFSTSQGELTPKDRSELALTNTRLPFGIPVTISFQIRISSDSDPTDTWFYALQLWQPMVRSPESDKGYPPIGGLRISRGTANEANFIVRSAAGTKGTRIAHFELPPDHWVQIRLRLIVNPGRESLVQVFKGKKKIAVWRGIMGYEPQILTQNWFRLKFGIYKGAEPDREFKLSYRRMKVNIAETYPFEGMLTSYVLPYLEQVAEDLATIDVVQ